MKIFDVSTGALVRTIGTPKGSTYAVSYSGDGRHLVTRHEDSSLRIWDAATGRELREIKPPGGHTHFFAFSRDGRWMAFGGEDGSIRRIDIETGQERRLDQPGETVHVAFHPAGRHLAASTGDGKVWVWDLTSDKPVRTIASDMGYGARLAFTPDGRTLAVTASASETKCAIHVFGMKP